MVVVISDVMVCVIVKKNDPGTFILPATELTMAEGALFEVREVMFPELTMVG